jgi:uncharacterized OsmC-like protein
MTVLTEDPPDAHDAWIKSVRATGSWQGSMTTDITIRGFTLRSDEPVAVGGTNSAPTPMEIVAGAVNACTTVVIEQVAAELGIHLEKVETVSAAHIDVRGYRGTADVSPHFRDYTLRVSVATTASEALRRTLSRQVEKRSPAISLVRDAGVALEIAWEFTTP